MIKTLSLSYQKNSDLIGAVASGLCLIHCIATPLLFIAQTCSATCCETSPIWWQWIDYLFLLISFFAVYRSNKTTSKAWIGKAMWISWALLFMLIINERFELISLPELALYLPALALISLHLYNQKYCQCNENCIHQNS